MVSRQKRKLLLEQLKFSIERGFSLKKIVHRIEQRQWQMILLQQEVQPMDSQVYRQAMTCLVSQIVLELKAVFLELWLST